MSRHSLNNRLVAARCRRTASRAAFAALLRFIQQAERVWRFQTSTNGQAGCDVGRSGISEGRSRHLRLAGSGGTDSFRICPSCEKTDKLSEPCVKCFDKSG